MTKIVLMDLACFFGSLAVYLILFFVLHVVVVRKTGGKHLATTLNVLIAISGLITLLIVVFGIQHAYSSFSTFLVGTLGVMISAVFILGFYGFSGPVCADRSPSAHMALVLRENMEEGLSRADWKARYGYERVFDRRAADFLDARVVKESAEKVKLTKKGRRLSFYYASLIRLLRLPKNY